MATRSVGQSLAAIEAGDRAAGIDVIREITALIKAGRRREAAALARVGTLMYDRRTGSSAKR